MMTTFARTHHHSLAATTTQEVVIGGRILIPLGSTEQHGPHLPLDTDTRIAVAVADRVAKSAGRDDLLVAPAIAYGASGEHQSFPGTVSIGTSALELTIVELVRSLQYWGGQVVLINGHGGNVEAVVAAVTRLRLEGHDVGWIPCVALGADAHAGHTETSILLHLSPGVVRMDRLEVGNTEALERLFTALVTGGVSAVSANGILGDAREANRADGKRAFEAMVRDAEARMVRGCIDARGTMVR